jgi:hypothetical protein
MQTNPFHARWRVIAAPGFWHDNTQCYVGQLISAGQQQAGIGTNTRHCPWCALLNEPLRNHCAPQAGVTIVLTRPRCRSGVVPAAHYLPFT